MKNITIVGKILLANEFRVTYDEEELLKSWFEYLIHPKKTKEEIIDSIVTLMYSPYSKYTTYYFMSVVSATLLSCPEIVDELFRQIRTRGHSASPEKIRVVVCALLYPLRKYAYEERAQLFPAVLDTVKDLLYTNPSAEKIGDNISDAINALPVACSEYFVTFLKNVKQLSEGKTQITASFKAALNDKNYCLNQLADLFSYFILRQGNASDRAEMAINLYSTLPKS